MRWLMTKHIAPLYKAIAELAMNIGELVMNVEEYAKAKDRPSASPGVYRVGIENGPHILIQCPPDMLEKAALIASAEMEKLVKVLGYKMEDETPYESGGGNSKGYA